MKPNMGLPETKFVLYLWMKWIFLKFCYKEIRQNTPKNWGQPLTFTAQEYCELY